MVILEIDVDGTHEALKQYPQAVTIFITVGDQELERRLRARGTDSEEAIRRRLEVARRETDQAASYAYRVVNDEIENAVDRIVNILAQKGLTA